MLSEFLTILTRKITEKLNLFNRSFRSKSSATSIPNDYENFLLEVLQITSKSGSDKQAVYPLLEANLDKLDDNLTVLLQHWATNTLSNAEENEAESIAKSIFDFSYCIQQYPHGSKAVNQDVAIAGYEIALSVGGNFIHFAFTIPTPSILTNKTNYHTWLSKINQKSQEKFDDDVLKFLKNFHNRTCVRLHEQIQTDLKYLSPGQDMFQQAIALSRGIVEIDQAERDEQQEKLEKRREQNFQTTVFAVASGLSVGGIVISASSQVTEKNPIQLPLSPTASVSPHPFILWVFGSIISGLVAAWITWCVTKHWQKDSANG